MDWAIYLTLQDLMLLGQKLGLTCKLGRRLNFRSKI